MLPELTLDGDARVDVARIVARAPRWNRAEFTQGPNEHAQRHVATRSRRATPPSTIRKEARGLRLAKLLDRNACPFQPPSNLGSQFISEEEDQAIIEARVMDALRAQFRPEFLNRIDEVVIFQRLKEEDLRRIVEIQLERLARILADRGLTVELTDAAKEFLATRGWDPVYGARPLKRAIQTHLQNPLAVALLEGRLGEGDHVLVDVSSDGEELTFERAGETAAAT